MSQLDQIAPGGVVQLQNSPASLDDATFDSLFPAESANVTVAPTAPAGTQAAPVQEQPPATQPPTEQTFLKGDHSVYKTPEAAIEGINQKDALIEQMRQRYALVTGVDPITGQQVQAVQQQQVELDYSQNPQKYLDDLYAASQKGPQAYAAVQQKFIMDTLKPVQPIMQNVVRTQAIEQASKDNPEVAKFISSPAYQKTLDANDDLKNAIATAESDQRFYSRLPSLLKLAHLAGQGMQMPELLRANSSQSQQIQTTPIRTTAQPTTPSPATQGAVKPSLGNIAGIRQTIADMEAKGQKLTF